MSRIFQWNRSNDFEVEVERSRGNERSKNWDQPRYFSEEKKRRRWRKSGESVYLHWIAGAVRGPEPRCTWCAAHRLDLDASSGHFSRPSPPPPPPRSWAIGNNPPTSSATKPTPRNALKIQRWAKRGSIRGRSTTDKGSLHAATKGWCSGPHYEKSFRTLRHVVKRERFLDADFSSSSGLDLFPSFITATMSPGEIELLRVVRFIPWSRFISRWTNGGTKGGRGCCERLFLFVVYKNKGVVKDEIEVHIYIHI